MQPDAPDLLPTSCSVLLLGTRPGVGVSTLAVQLAGLLQSRLAAATGTCQDVPPAHPLPTNQCVVLLDLGRPVGDCQLYMNLTSTLNVVDAARALHRIDATHWAAAMTRASNGVAMLSLPEDLEQMRDVSQTDMLALFERMHALFGLLLMDASGWWDAEWVSALARVSTETWLISDQSVGSLAALQRQIKLLQTQLICSSHLKLVVNHYDERYGMTAAQIAQRFGLQLIGTLPDRPLPLIVCGNQGKLLHAITERDPYIAAMIVLVEAVWARQSVKPAACNAWLAAWLPSVHDRLTHNTINNTTSNL